MRLKFRPQIIWGLVLTLVIGFIAQAGLAHSPSSNSNTRETRESQGVSIVLFENVKIFNGTSENLSAPCLVLAILIRGSWVLSKKGRSLICY